jgi:DNA-binding ferritin-like protein
MDTIRANGHLSPEEKTTRVDALTQEVSERLTALEGQSIQMQTQIEELQWLLRQQGNPILAYTVERVKEVMEQNLTMARQHLTAIMQRQSLA